MKKTRTTKIPNNVAPPKFRNVQRFKSTEKGLGLDAYETQGNL